MHFRSYFENGLSNQNDFKIDVADYCNHVEIFYQDEVKKI